MTAATFESRGIFASRSGHSEYVLRCALLDVELDDLHLSLREDVGLTGGGNADDPADRVSGLELGADDEVDVQLTDAPQLHVLDVGRADHRRRASGLATREHAGDEIDLVARGAGDDEVGVLHPGRGQNAPTRPVALDGYDVVTLRERGEPRGLGVEHRDLVIVVECFDDRETDLARSDEEDPHWSGEKRTPATRAAAATVMRCVSSRSSRSRPPSRRSPDAAARRSGKRLSRTRFG